MSEVERIPSAKEKIIHDQPWPRKCQLQMETANVFQTEILIPVIKIVDAYMSKNHGLCVDEFCVLLFSEKQAQNYCKSNGNAIKFLIEDLENTEIPDISTQFTIVHLFMSIMRFEILLRTVSEDYFTRRQYRKKNLSETMVLIYILVFRISSLAVEQSVHLFLLLTINKMLSLISYLLEQDKTELFHNIGCTIYDETFVRKNISASLTKALPFLKDLRDYLKDLKRRKKCSLKKSNTVPLSLNVLNHPKRLPPVPPPTPENLVRTTFAKKVPKTTYNQPTIEEKLAFVRNVNKMHALNLLGIANKNAPSCLRRQRSPKRIIVGEQEFTTHKIVRKPPPNFEPVEVKQTAASILRECARIFNEEVKETKKWKELTEGSFNPDSINKLEEERRQEEKEMYLRKIKEKHLIALIAREGAYIAKQSILNSAKIKGENMRKEKKELYEKLERWRQEYNKEMMEMVEKCRELEQASRDAYYAMLNEKRQKAAEVCVESQQLKLLRMQQKEEETRKRAQLIQEIKALHCSRTQYTKEFDPSESSGLGLLCEMSLAELKERLISMKTKMNEEMENRKILVKQERDRQRNKIRNCQQTIDRYRANRCFVPSNTTAKENTVDVTRSPEIEALRKELEKRRAMRLQK